MAAKKGAGKRKVKKKEPKSHRLRLHDVLLSPDCILKKVFRKDGPPLGIEFDSLPSHAFEFCKKGRKGSKCSHRHCQDKQRALKVTNASRSSAHAFDETQRALKKRKVSKPTLLDYPVCSMESVPVKKHGIGKGLMTVWRAINPDGGDFPTGVNYNERESTAVFRMATSAPRKPLVQDKKPRKRQPVMRKLGTGTKVPNKKKTPINRRKVESHNTRQMKPHKEKCELALDRVVCQEDLEQFAKLIDDEELELQELRAGPNPVTCSAHFATNGLHGCSLCKDLLAKFPPDSVVMKLSLYLQPWGSSPELVKKLFKVFHFIYSYAVLFNIHSFTLDEFAQAFHDKDSMLLGQIHLTLLELLLSDVDTELSRGFFPPVSNNGKFVELLHSVENQQNVVEFWKKSLNPLTWTEVLRQVFLAAGFGSKNVTPRKESLSKEVTIMVKYGLSPATLKGELFSILSEQGNNGMKVSDLANSPQIVDLNLAASTEELESLISSALSSDITLFEKISCAAYRLRIHPVMEEAETFDLDSEDFGSVDNDSKDNDIYSSDDDSECGSDRRRLDQGGSQKKGNGALTVYTEIDESHPGEVWLLGLIEGEYSDLSIAEKLNALVALVDLLSAGSSIRMEDRRSPSMESVHTLNHYGSGAKIKRSAGSSNHSWPSSFGGYIGQMLATKDTISGLHPVDSSAFMLKFCGNAKSCSQRKYANETDAEVDLHPMQSIFLGSDRRYNRYWLFLGPCNGLDPGHKRIYFESSEDGHWEVIDTEEALCNLLSALDCRGAREAYLLASLKRREMFLCQSIQSDQSEVNISRDDSSSAVSELDNNICLSEMNNDFSVSSSSKLLKTGNKEEKMQKWSSLQAFDAWIWNSFYSELNAVKYSKRSYLDSLTRCECCHDLYWRDEKHCKTCHTTFELDFDLEERYAIHVATCKADGEADMFPNHKVLSSQLQALKAAIHAIESVMPEGALVGAWIKSAHKLWIKRLRRTSTLAEFLQVLADFVGAINEDWCQSDDDQGFNSVLGEIISSFKTMSQTSSAVAVWLVKMDALIAPFLKRETVTRFRGQHASNL